MVVVDCGFSLEADEEISFDTVAPRRNGATLAVLSDADLVLAVGSADPPGMERLVRGPGWNSPTYCPRSGPGWCSIGCGAPRRPRDDAV